MGNDKHAGASLIGPLTVKKRNRKKNTKGKRNEPVDSGNFELLFQTLNEERETDVK